MATGGRGGLEVRWPRGGSGHYVSSLSEPGRFYRGRAGEAENEVTPRHPLGAPAPQGNRAMTRPALDRGVADSCTLAEVLLRPVYWDSVLRSALCASQVQEVVGPADNFKQLSVVDSCA